MAGGQRCSVETGNSKHVERCIPEPGGTWDVFRDASSASAIDVSYKLNEGMQVFPPSVVGRISSRAHVCPMRLESKQTTHVALTYAMKPKS